MKERTAETMVTYNRIAADYAEKKKFAYPVKELVKFSALLQPGSTILSVGCGAGRDEAVFRDAGFRPVLGIDLSEELLKIGKTQHQEVNFVKANTAQLPVREASVNALWAHEVLHHFDEEDMPHVLGEFGRVLAPGGLLYISTREGNGVERIRENLSSGEERVYTLVQPDTLDSLLTDAGFAQDTLYTFNEQDRGGRDLKWISAFYRNSLTP